MCIRDSINAILKGLDKFPKLESKVREQLNIQLKSDGIESLEKELKVVDPITHANIDLKNSHRMIRALEIYRGTGKPYSYYLNKEKETRNFKIIKIGLKADRTIIYKRINERVDKMLKKGLLEEVKSVYSYRTLNALNTVGYKELFKHLDGDWSLDYAVEEIKKNTRRFAKRQITWFKKEPNTVWFDYKDPIENFIGQIKKEMETIS